MNKRFFCFCFAYLFAVCCTFSSHFAFGEGLSDQYSTWHLTKQCENMRIDADVYGYSDDCTVRTLQCSRSAWTSEEEAKMVATIYPKLGTSMSFDTIQLVEVKDGKALGAIFDREATYSFSGWDGSNTALIFSFSDNCIFVTTEQFAPYETVTYASTATEGYEWVANTFGDLSFATQSQIIQDANDLLTSLGLSADSTPFFTIVYTDSQEDVANGTALAYREFFMKGEDMMAPYREKVSEYGGECYQLNYSILYDGIPTSLLTRYLTTKDTYNDPPTVQIWYNKNGVIYLRAWNYYHVVSKSDPIALFDVESAIGVADGYLGNIIADQEMTCRKIRLEYYTLNYKGGAEGRDYELVPMWTFYFDNGAEPIIVNALTGELVW